MIRHVLILLAILAPLTSLAQELHVANPYQNLLYEDPMERTGDLLRPAPWFSLGGHFRFRADHFGNLDLDRGPTPTSGLTVAGTQPGTGGDFSGADVRLLVDPALHLGPEVTIRTGFVLFDNLALGSTPSAYPATADLPMPAGSTSQASPVAGLNSQNDAIGIRTLSLEWLSPMGLFVLGRTAGDWGLGMVANSGIHPDADLIQSVDRIAYITSIFDTLIALSYDFDANGGHAGSLHDLTDADDLRTINLALAHYKLPSVAGRQIRAGQTIFHWGISGSYRWQDEDLPNYYATSHQDYDGNPQSSEWVARGLDAVVVDGWLRLASSSFTLEAEAAWLYSQLDNASLLAGVETKAVTANQYGGVLRARYRTPGGHFTVTGEAGLASGDEAPGFGVNAGAHYAPQPGDLDGSQVRLDGPNADRKLTNFRFNPNFHVDEILWRRIVGTVSDGVYGKLTARVDPTHWLYAEVAGIYSRALYAQSAPGVAKDLGVETDVTLGVDIADGLQGKIVGAFLVPLDGFRNLNVLPARDPSPAWAVRAVFHAGF